MVPGYYTSYVHMTWLAWVSIFVLIVNEFLQCYYIVIFKKFKSKIIFTARWPTAGTIKNIPNGGTWVLGEVGLVEAAEDCDDEALLDLEVGEEGVVDLRLKLMECVRINSPNSLTEPMTSTSTVLRF